MQKVPGGLASHHITNFDLLREAHKNQDLALVSAIRKSDGKTVALVCAINRKDGMIYPEPLAIMLDRDPWNDFEDPTALINKAEIQRRN